MKKRGFTLAELLIVVAIIGVLAAISIPILFEQRKKAVIAANKANIRAAKAAAASFYYDKDFKTMLSNNNLKCQFYIYDTENGTLENISSKYNNHAKFNSEAMRETYDKAVKYQVCRYVYVYVGESDKNGKKTDINIETAPYYVGDKVSRFKNNNPFGMSQ